MFLRFVVGGDGEDHRLLDGIFTQACVLRDESVLEPHEEDWLETVFDWFNTYLPCPPFSRGRFPEDAVSWFRADSARFITRMWDIAAIIANHDVPVRRLRSRNPGKLVYEDDYQVLVRQWRSL